MKKLFLILFLAFFLKTNATTYYISTSGNNGSAGTSEATSWLTLVYALGGSSPVVAGDIIYIKAGTYSSQNIVCAKDGSVGSPIQVIGYTSIPGDTPPLLVNNANPYTSYTTTDMPTFTGSNRNTGIWCDLRNHKFITMKNIQVEAYAYGLISGGTTQTDYGYHYFYNVNFARLGNTASSYDGRGFSLGNVDTSRSSYNTLQYCLVVNSQAEGITIAGNRNSIYGCKVYTNEAAHPTQYFITIFGDENTVNRCYIEQNSAIAVSGTHGYTIKSNAEKVVDAGLAYPAYNPRFNIIRNSTVRNVSEGYCFRHRGVQYNMVDSCKAYGTHKGSDASSGLGNGCLFRDGASYNIVQRLFVDSCNNGIGFDKTTEDGGAGGSTYCGVGNVVVNSVIVNCYTPIKYGIDGGVAAEAGPNTIANCTFYLTRYLHYAARRCTLMVYKANIYYGNSATGYGGYFRGSTYSTDVIAGQFTDCSSYNQQGGMPIALTYTVDPTFVNGASRNFNLQSSSGLKNGATNLTPTTNPNIQFATPSNKLQLMDVTQYNYRDFNGIPRASFGSYMDLGAFEYHP